MKKTERLLRSFLTPPAYRRNGHHSSSKDFSAAATVDQQEKAAAGRKWSTEITVGIFATITKAPFS